MMVRLSSVLFLTLLVCFVFTELVSAASTRKKNNYKSRELTKNELCYQYNLNCARDLPLLIKITFEYNSDALAMKSEVVHSEFKKKTLQNEIKILRHRIDHPSEPALKLPELSISMTGMPLVNFHPYVAESGELSCPSLLNCLTTINQVKEYIVSLDDRKRSYQSQVKSLTKEIVSLKGIVYSLKQKIARDKSRS